MTAAAEAFALAAEFPSATREQWLALTAAVLKGADFDKRLVSRTADGLRVDPLYDRAADARPLAGRMPGLPWQVMTRVDHPDAGAANAEALHELEHGAGALAFVFAGAAGAYGFGLSAGADRVQRALAGIQLDAGISLEFDHAGDGDELARVMRALPGDAAGKADIRFGLDPLGAAAAGTQAMPWTSGSKVFAARIADLAALGLKGPFAVSDGRRVHAAGGTEAQELAFVLSVALAYLRALEAGGIALADARRMIFFRLAADADQFLTVAKFRAMRKLWARIEEACGLTPEPAFITAETAWRMMTRRDPWVNILRTTMATFAAGIGGADAIVAVPFTIALGLPDRFARRIARNMQLILLEEASLAKVADPVAGSGGIESLTAQLCAAAWALFQKIEASGGAPAALESGLIQETVAAARAAREKSIAQRKDALTGTSEFPHLAELPVSVLAPSPPDTPIAPGALAPVRLAEPFERLREMSDAVLASTGARPRVFLANLGAPADFTARAGFAKNFFEAGGIEAVMHEGVAARSQIGEATTDMTALANAFKSSGARVACLCSSDAVYATDAPAAARALAEAGPTDIYLAGRPGVDETSLRGAGVTGFIFAGCNVPQVLGDAYAKNWPAR